VCNGFSWQKLTTPSPVLIYASDQKCKQRFHQFTGKTPAAAAAAEIHEHLQAQQYIFVPN